MDSDLLDDLYKYVKERDYSGYDLYDSLNARLPRYSGLFKSRLFRLFWIQFNKRSPINLRPLFLTPEGFNVKGGALFLLGLINLYKSTGDKKYLEDIDILYQRILFERINTGSGTGFGYNFDWEARAFSVPVGTANAVTTVYVAKALIEYARLFGGDLSGILSEIKDFFVSQMIIFEDDNGLCFRYIPGEDTRVHNANLLIASFLSDYYILSGARKESLKEKVRKAVNFSVSELNSDLSWPYGSSSFHQWVDNFHTAFNIESLLNVSGVFPEFGLDGIIANVTKYYINELFDADGTPKYYNDRLYPVDVHVLAEVKILFNVLSEGMEKYGIDRERARIIVDKNNEWIMKFRSGKGYFFCSKGRFLWNKIPYIRWGQAWMFYALSTDLVLKETLS